MSFGSVCEIFQIGVGPSSSHSMGPQRAADVFLEKVKTPPSTMRVILYGSLAATAEGHMTGASLKAVLGGLPLELVCDFEKKDIPHPNTMRFEALDDAGDTVDAWTVYSVGGGVLEDEHGRVGGRKPVEYPVANIGEAIEWCREKDWAFWQLVEAVEPEAWTRLGGTWDVMCACVERGISCAIPYLPGSLRVPRRAASIFAHTDRLQPPEKDLALIAAYALAVAEENAAGGEVVTAPTCGSSGIVPGILYYYAHHRGETRENILRALATAGLFGECIRANASISGAQVGCQGEVGTACSMAAAAASQLQGGTLYQVEYAAEMGMEHHLGLTCDPVEGYVQIPCIERNSNGALRAFECAGFSLLTDGRHLVSFDEVVDVMHRTGRDIQSAYKETAVGGLAELWRRRSRDKK